MAIDVKIEGSGKVAEALVDTLSPVTNLFGTMGDKVRVYRELSLLRTLSRAKEIAKKENLLLTEPPTKFLVPYLEECSLESGEDELLTEMWARLLASASIDFKSEHNLFIRLMREMTGAEARVFEYLVDPLKDREYEGPWHLDDIETSWHNPYIYIKLEDSVEKLGSDLSKNTDFSVCEKNFKAIAETPGSRVYFFYVNYGKEGKYPLETAYECKPSMIEQEFDIVSVAMLKSLGLIGDYISSEFWFGEFMFEVRSYYVTTLGARFTKACTGYRVSGQGEQLDSIT